jgi:hypothetical protein
MWVAELAPDLYSVIFILYWKEDLASSPWVAWGSTPQSGFIAQSCH